MASSSIPVAERQMSMLGTRVLRRHQGENTFALLLPMVLLVYSALLPQEVRISVAGQVIYPYRAVALLLLPWLLNRIATGRMPFRFADLWMFAGVAWIVVSFCAFYGFGDGIRRGGALAFDVVAPYLITRCCVRSFQDLRRVLIIVAPGLLLAGISMMIESVTHKQLIRPLGASIFGPLPYFENGQAVSEGKDFYVVRLGLLRASGPFSHPILGGLFMASFLPIFAYSSIKKWPFVFGLVASLTAIFSVSSAAFLSFIITCIFFGYDKIIKYINGFGWKLFLFAISAFLFLIETASQKGVMQIIIRYTLDPSTGWFRQLIWKYGTQSIEKNPWFGIGFTDYERLPWMINSIDNHWLLLGVRHGYITPSCIFMACLVSAISLSQASVRFGHADGKMARSLVCSLVGLVILGFTTSYFGGILTWFSCLIALNVSLSSKNNYIT